ncbi:VOC family protein [Ilumatobacter sp.]|uniref:VOC family protein n=1 Tax=Ilumatobacter sp. TaxID=1967498 RepID=UPI003C3CD48C
MATDLTNTTVWPILHYRDIDAALACLVGVFGFHEALLARDDSNQVVHAELSWPTGGTVLVGSTRHTGGVHGHLQPGTSAMYVPTSDVDAIHQRAVAAGLSVIQHPHTTRFGNGADAHAFSVRDTEGYAWTFGDYAGA